MGTLHKRSGVRVGLWMGAGVAIAGGLGCRPQQTDIVRSFRLADGTEYSYVNRSSGYGFNPNDTDEEFGALATQARPAHTGDADGHEYRVVRPTPDSAPVRYVAVPAAPQTQYVPVAPVTFAPTSVTTVAGNMWSYAGTSPYGGTMAGTGMYPSGLGAWGYPMLPGPVQLPNFGAMPVPAGIMPNAQLMQGAPVVCPPWPR